MHLHRSYLKLSSLLLALLFLGSCEEPYSPEVINQAPNLLVVSGFINSQGPTTIRLSRTQNLEDANAPAAETKALVVVEEENGGKFPLQETAPGVYTNNGLSLNQNKRYRLFIKTGGQEYASEYGPVKVTPAIENVTWQAEPDGLQVYVSTRDPQNNSRYYRWEYEEAWEYSAYYYSTVEYLNNSIKERPQDKNIFLCWKFNNSSNVALNNTVKLSQDIIANFALVKLPANSDRFSRKYSILVKQYALTKEAYEYQEALKKNTESLGSLFDPLPTQLTGNIKSLTTPNEPVIGFVHVTSVEQKRIFINKAELPVAWRAPSQNCPLDTVPLGQEASYFASGTNIPVQPLLSSGNQLIGHTGASKACVDCRVFGSKMKPDFWQ